MNDINNNVEVVDPTLPFTTEIPGIVTDGEDTIAYVSEETVDVPVED